MVKRKWQPETVDINGDSEIVDNMTIPDDDTDYAPDPNEARYGVSLALPIGVLIALLDPQHDMADTESAVRLGLLGSGGTLSTIGKLVAVGFDQTAVRHKMNAAWRASHNAPIDKRNGLS